MLRWALAGGGTSPPLFAVLGRNSLSAKTLGIGAPLLAQEAEWVENSLWRAEQVDEDGAATIRRAA
ncbi:MAG: hypothetical protein OXC09_13390 [Truepera sp.]|nr:hypothetical protein [Truepera sp.]